MGVSHPKFWSILLRDIYLGGELVQEIAFESFPVISNAGGDPIFPWPIGAGGSNGLGLWDANMTSRHVITATFSPRLLMVKYVKCSCWPSPSSLVKSLLFLIAWVQSDRVPQYPPDLS